MGPAGQLDGLEVLRALPDGALVADEQGRLRLINDAAAALLHVEPAPLLGQPLSALPGGEQWVGLDHERAGVVDLPRQRIEVRPLALPGELRVLLLRDLGQLVRAALKTDDVRRFVGRALHDLNKFLSVMKAAADLLLMPQIGSLSDMQHQLVQRVKSGAGRQSAMLGALADLYALESGALALRREEVAPAELLQALVAARRTELVERGLSLSLELGPRLPAIFVDRERLRDLLSSLIDNARDYTAPGGSVVVAASAEDSSLCVEVRDSGAGIPWHDQPQIFSSFFRADNQEPGRMPGLGMSLALARRVVELHGGSMTCKSEPGQGTTMRIRFQGTGSRGQG